MERKKSQHPTGKKKKQQPKTNNEVITCIWERKGTFCLSVPDQFLNETWSLWGKKKSSVNLEHINAAESFATT